MEMWIDIEGFPGYQISSEGRVRSHDKITSSKLAKERHWKNRIIHQKISKSDGRARVCLWANGKEQTMLVHRLQAIAFLGHPQGDDMTVNHKDGNPLNNVVENLEWVTRAENIRMGFESGLYDSTKRKCLLVDADKKERMYSSLSEAGRAIGKKGSSVWYALNSNRPIKGSDGEIYFVREVI